MSVLNLAMSNLLSPLPLCFALGALAVGLRGNLRLPEQAFDTLGIYLMLAIGLHGGKEIAGAAFSSFAPAALFALSLGILIPVAVLVITRWIPGVSDATRAAIAAHYGSVSAVTFAAATSYAVAMGTPALSWSVAVLALMEAPAIFVALAWWSARQKAQDSSWKTIWGEVLGGKSVLLLVGGILIGVLVGDPGYARIAPLFDGLYQGVLCLFLLELGSLSASRLRDLGKAGKWLVLFGIFWPLSVGSAVALLGHAVVAHSSTLAVMATLAASASYIAAPAAIRMAIPQASPGIYLTLSLAVTFPVNLLLGIPLYYALATWG